MSETAQEPRNERTTINLTKSEKIALRFVAGARDMTEAAVLREHIDFSQIIELHERMRAKLAEVA